MGFSESSYANLEAELGASHASRWHHALAVFLTLAAMSIGWAIGG